MTEDILSQIFSNIDLQAAGGTSLAAVLGAVWIFARMIRKIISVAITLCLVYVLLHVGGVDFSHLLSNVMH